MESRNKVSMKVLSFDVGIKNLAYCLFDSETNKILEQIL